MDAVKIARRLSAFWIGFLLLAIVFAIVHYPMSWGLMDDATNLFSVRHRWVGQSLWYVLQRESRVLWFRPVYTFFVYVAYHIFLHSPKAFYMANFSLVILSLIPWGMILVRQSPPECRIRSVLAFGLLLLSATPLYNLVVYLSLQEKFLLLFGGWSLWLVDKGFDDLGARPRRAWVQQTAAMAFFILGLWSKPTTIALAPWAIIALLFMPTFSITHRCFFAALWIAVAGTMSCSFLQRRDSYSAKYSTDPAHLLRILFHQSLWAYALILLALSTLIVLVFAEKKSQRVWLSASILRKALWPVTLLAYLGALLPWGIQTYLWAPAMVFATGCLILLGNAFLLWARSAERRSEIAAFLVATLAAGFVVFRIAIPRLARQSEIGTMAGWLSNRLPNLSVKVYVMAPCEEATGALQYYSGNTQSFYYLTQEQSLPAGQAWLITRDECPIAPDRALEFQRIIYQLPHWTVYERTS